MRTGGNFAPFSLGTTHDHNECRGSAHLQPRGPSQRKKDIEAGAKEQYDHYRP